MTRSPEAHIGALLTGWADDLQAPQGSLERVRRRASQRRARTRGVQGAVALTMVAGTALIVRSPSADRSIRPADSAGPGATGGPTTSTGGTTADSVTITTTPVALDARTVLLTGSDTNPCVDPASPWANAADPSRVGGGRFDTIMLLRVDPNGRSSLVSFPRDLWVDLPGRGRGRLATAGDDLPQTLYDNFGVEVDHRIDIDFCALPTMVDAVGGVPVPLPAPLRDSHTGLDITAAGCHLFSGDEALAYLRSRHLTWQDAQGTWHEDPASDLGRIDRQQDFVRRLLTAVRERGLVDRESIIDLFDQLQEHVVRDQNLLSVDSVLELAGLIGTIDPAQLVVATMPATPAFVGGESVLQPDRGSAEALAVLGLLADAPGALPTAGPAAEILPDPAELCPVG